MLNIHSSQAPVRNQAVHCLSGFGHQQIINGQMSSHRLYTNTLSELQKQFQGKKTFSIVKFISFHSRNHSELCKNGGSVCTAEKGLGNPGGDFQALSPLLGSGVLPLFSAVLGLRKTSLSVCVYTGQQQLICMFLGKKTVRNLKNALKGTQRK